MDTFGCYPPVKHYSNPVPPVKDGFERRYVKYLPADYIDTHSKAIGYLFWLVGFTGSHRFYYGKTLTGILWFFTFGLFGIGWLVDFFLIPAMDRQADQQFAPGAIDYSMSWVLLVFLGVFGVHRFYQARVFTGIMYLFTLGFFGLGIVYDVLTMNGTISDVNLRRHPALM